MPIGEAVSVEVAIIHKFIVFRGFESKEQVCSGQTTDEWEQEDWIVASDEKQAESRGKGMENS